MNVYLVTFFDFVVSSLTYLVIANDEHRAADIAKAKYNADADKLFRYPDDWERMDVDMVNTSQECAIRM